MKDPTNWMMAFIFAMPVGLYAAFVYSINADVWCAAEGKRAVTGFFIYTCVEKVKP